MLRSEYEEASSARFSVWSQGRETFAEEIDDFTRSLTVPTLAALFHGLTEQPMLVEIEEPGTTMTITGLVAGILTLNDPLASLTACKGEPCGDS